jgi:hypothetical protein
VLSEGSRSKADMACLLASFVPSARLAMVAAFAAILVFSSPLASTSHSLLATQSSRKAPRISITKAKALSPASHRGRASGRRAAPRRLTRRPSLRSLFASARHDLQPIFRPLRC